MNMLDKIRAAMADRNMNEVSRRVGIHPNTLHRIRKGQQSPSYDTLTKLAEYFRVTENG